MLPTDTNPTTLEVAYFITIIPRTDSIAGSIISVYRGKEPQETRRKAIAVECWVNFQPDSPRLQYDRPGNIRNLITRCARPECTRFRTFNPRSGTSALGRFRSLNQNIRLYPPGCPGTVKTSHCQYSTGPRHSRVSMLRDWVELRPGRSQKRWRYGQRNVNARPILVMPASCVVQLQVQ